MNIAYVIIRVATVLQKTKNVIIQDQDKVFIAFLKI